MKHSDKLKFAVSLREDFYKEFCRPVTQLSGKYSFVWKESVNKIGEPIRVLNWIIERIERNSSEG